MKQDVLTATGLTVFTVLFLVLTQRSGIENAFIFFTGPWCIATDANPLSGNAFFILNNDIYHNENTSVLYDQAMLAGQAQNESFYALRPGIGLLAFLFFPFLKPTAAAQAALWLLATCVTLSGYLAARLCGESRLRSTLWACLLLSLSSIMFHVNDLSAHLGGSAFWVFNLLLLVWLRPWHRESPVSSTALSHGFLIFSTFFYAINVVIYFAFVLMTISRIRAFAINILIFVASLNIRSIWAWLANVTYGRNVDYGKIERLQFIDTLNTWSEKWNRGGIYDTLMEASKITTELMLSEPLTVVLLTLLIAILVAKLIEIGPQRMILDPDSTIIFLCLCVGGALLGGIIWGAGISTRGYISYGIPITLVFLIIYSVQFISRKINKAAIIIPLALIVTISLQQVWTKSHLLGNPVPSCHYWLPIMSLTETLGAFAGGFSDSLKFVPLESDRPPGTVSDLAAEFRHQATHLSETVSGSTIAAVNDRAKMWRSFVLVTFLLAPVTAAVAVGARMMVPAWSWRRCSVTACLMMLFLWAQAWIIAPFAKSDGERLRHLIFLCDTDTQDVRYRITLSSSHIELMRELGITHIKIRSGWRITNNSKLESVQIHSDLPRINSLIYETGNNNWAQWGIPISIIERISEGGTNDVTLFIKEAYNKPINRYFGWQQSNPGLEARKMSSCNKKVVPAIDVRGYRNGQQTSVLFFY